MKRIYFSPTMQLTAVVNNRMLMISDNLGLEYSPGGGNPDEAV